MAAHALFAAARSITAGKASRKSWRWVIAAAVVGMIPLPVLAVLTVGVLVCGALIGFMGSSNNAGGSCAAPCATPTSATAPAAVSASKADMAKALMDSGKLYPLAYQPDHLPEIQAIADGKAREGCDIDARILAILTLIVQRYDEVGISDINRQCTNQWEEGGGRFSSHWIAGGGQAIDLFAINGVPLTGGDEYSLEIIALLDPMVPNESRIGQEQCRGSNDFANFHAFYDECSHLHIDVAYTTESGGLLAQ